MTVWTDLLGVEFCTRFVDADGVRTRSLQAGEGEPLLFLHGTTGHLDSFSRNVGPHAQHFAVHAIDMLGHGYTDKPNYPYTIDRYAAHILAYLDTCGIERAHIVGQSLGGWVAAWIASEEPERVAKLTLVAPGGTVANPEMMKKIRTTTLAAAENADPEYTRKRLQWLMYDPITSVTDELVAIRHGIYQQPEMRSSVHNVLVLQEMDIRKRYLMDAERLGRIKTETLVLWSSDNPGSNLEEGRFWHESIPGSQWAVVDQAGHWPNYEQAEQFNRLNLAFLLGKQ